ncbi:hypothetical protein V1514DRAFT_345528 [Lipomyces japonicus]|uniref:uncharacterized protein n=1 Tax=Lipomyces japonicus TaxID=56871 RepID=UPI0034CE303B
MVNTSSSPEANDPPESTSGICGSTPDEQETVDEPPPLIKEANSATSSPLDGKEHKHHHHDALNAPAHVQQPGAIAATLKSDLDVGLAVKDATARLDADGKNVLESDSGTSMLSILIRQVSNSLTLVLVVAMSLSYGTKDWIEGGVITVVIFLNIVIGFVQDFKAERTMQSLLSLSAPVATVIRDGQLLKISSQDIVAGDIVKIKVGDVVPADLRLFEGMNLECDEALLTGESLAAAKTPYDTFDDLSIPIGDRTNIAYSSSVVTKGRGTGIVVATGMRTEVGKIAQLLKTDPDSNCSNDDSDSVSSVDRKFVFKAFSAKLKYSLKKTLGLVGTPLQVTLSKFAILLFGMAILLAIIVFSASKWIVDSDVLIYGICVAVAVIPESLIAVLTITLSVATKAMAKGHVLVRKMQALEALGGVTDICSDKTGTLTQGKMITRRVWVPALDGLQTIAVRNTTSPYSPESGYLEVNNKVIEPQKILNQTGNDNTFSMFLTAIGLCNLATVSKTIDEKSTSSDAVWSGHGEPTEISLQVFAMRFAARRESLEASGWKILVEHPFDSSIKRMSVVYESPDGERYVFIKGAVEAVSMSLVEASFDAELLRQKVDYMTRDGLRVLCIAFRHLPADLTIDTSKRDQVETELSFLGITGLYDPPRLETRGAVLKSQRAGIKVHMLTGDHPGTARAIAYETGILSDSMPLTSFPHAVMIAADFDALSDSEIDAMPELPLVIARCAPATKVRMVDALHRRKAFCVMTGDGVNDSPALKRADVGIAMGLNGSDVAKDASDIVLTNDDFASIVRAIEEGRRLFDNIQKFLVHLLISNISQVILLLCGLAFKDRDGVSVFPLSPLEILWANMITSSFLAMGLGMEEAQPDIMLRPPHDLKVGVFTKEVIVDKMIYGTAMGILCLVSFVVVIFGAESGELGINCNHGYNATCDPVYRARAVSFAVLSFLLLLTAWEVKHFGRSLFNLDPFRHKSKFSIFPALYYNKFLFWAVIGGFLGTFPVIYIPIINKDVFKHLGISWEWGVVAAACVVYLAVVEVWKAIKRRFGIWSGKLTLTDDVIRELEKTTDLTYQRPCGRAI